MRFLVFWGDIYYPCGGWEDFRKGFDRLSDAIEYRDEHRTDWQWSHVVDTEKLCIVYSEKEEWE